MLGRNREGTLVARGRAPAVSDGRRACPRCGASALLTEDNCGNCGRRLHNPYRAAARASLLVVVLLCSTILVNFVIQRWQGENRNGEMSRQSEAERRNRREARQSFAAQLAGEYDKQRAGVRLDLNGDELNIITFTSPKFTRAHADELIKNKEVMNTLRSLGFRQVWFANNAGGRWVHDLQTSASPER